MFFKRERAGAGFLIVGLGNPGKRYEHSRHNAGWRALDALAAQYKINVSRARFQSLCGEGRVGGAKVLLLKPVTYMNLSGSAVLAAANYYNVSPDHVLVIYDDTHLAPGVLRIRAEGSAGGHNGVASVIDMLETEAFPRIKIGVGEKPNANVDLADWVLAAPSSADSKLIAARTDDVITAAELIVVGKLTEAQSRFNGG